MNCDMDGGLGSDATAAGATCIDFALSWTCGLTTVCTGAESELGFAVAFSVDAMGCSSPLVIQAGNVSPRPLPAMTVFSNFVLVELLCGTYRASKLRTSNRAGQPSGDVYKNRSVQCTCSLINHILDLGLIRKKSCIECVQSQDILCVGCCKGHSRHSGIPNCVEKE